MTFIHRDRELWDDLQLLWDLLEGSPAPGGNIDMLGTNASTSSTVGASVGCIVEQGFGPRTVVAATTSEVAQAAL